MDMLQNQVEAIEVLRGVEDGPAFEAGLSNTTTARDLGVIMSALGRGEVVSPKDPDQADGVAAEISRIVFDHQTRKL